MNKQQTILVKYLNEQIAIEEQLHQTMSEQIAEIDLTSFADAKHLISRTIKALEKHFAPLNLLLDKLLKLGELIPKVPSYANGKDSGIGIEGTHRLELSKLLKQYFSALNLISISNAQLHTVALTLGAEDVAKLALQHLENIAPIVSKLRELIPEVIAGELASTNKIDPATIKTALMNTELAWKKAY